MHLLPQCVSLLSVRLCPCARVCVYVYVRNNMKLMTSNALSTVDLGYYCYIGPLPSFGYSLLRSCSHVICPSILVLSSGFQFFTIKRLSAPAAVTACSIFLLMKMKMKFKLAPAQNKFSLENFVRKNHLALGLVVSSCGVRILFNPFLLHLRKTSATSVLWLLCTIRRCWSLWKAL